MRPAQERERVRLCIASPSFVPAFGGAELRFRRYLPGLRARGVDAFIVTGTPKGKKQTRSDREADWAALAPGESVPSEPLDGCAVVRVRLPDRGASERAAVLFGALEAHCRDPRTRPDVVQLLGRLPLRTLPALVRLRRLGIPLVHAAAIAPSAGGGEWRRRWRRLERRWVLERLDAIVAPNAPLRDELVAGGVRTPVEVIPHGVDLARFRPAAGPDERASARAELGVGPGDVLLLCVGSVHPRKGTHLLLEAFAELAPRHPGLHVALAGPRRDLEAPGLDDFRARLEAARARSGAPDRVHFLGEVHDVERWLRAADVFVLASEREGMPNAVLEAMASGLAVVVTPFAGLSRDLGEPDRELVLAAREAPALAAAVGGLLDDRDRRRALGAAARAWVEKTLGLEAALDRYAALYRALGHARARRA